MRYLVDPHPEYAVPQGVSRDSVLQLDAGFLQPPLKGRGSLSKPYAQVLHTLGPHTRQVIEERYGSLCKERCTLHPLPWFISLSRYDHAREPDTLLHQHDKSWGQPDKDWEAFTAQGRWCDAMLRLVSGWNESGEFSRVPKDWISLDEFSIGIAHYWADTAPKLLADFVAAFPELSAEAWGEAKAIQMREEIWLRSQIRALTGKRAHQAKYNWLCAGWWFAARKPQAISWQATEWLQRYGRSAKRTIQYFGWMEHLGGSDGGRILAAVIRMVNSGGARGKIRAGHRLVGEKATPMKVLEAAYNAPKGEGGYGQPDRWLHITQWPGFAGSAPPSLTVPLPEK